MNKIQIVNVLLTQRCNLSCDYCHLVKNYNGKLTEYPDMKYYADNELTAKQWIEIFERILLNNPSAFFILYGGEPFLYFELGEILNWMHRYGVDYTIISNNTDGVQNNIEGVLSYLSDDRFQGFTSSVDPLIFEEGGNVNKLSDRYKKSKAGFDRLIKMSDDWLADDIVAEITADKSNIHLLYKTVYELSQYGIFSSITCIDDKKNHYYDFAAKPDESLLLTPEDVHDEFQKCQYGEDVLVHSPNLLPKLEQILPANMKCRIFENIHNLTLSPNGHPRLCLRIRGVETPGLTINECIDSAGITTDEFCRRLALDYVDYCEGCNWTCMLMSKMFSGEIVDHK